MEGLKLMYANLEESQNQVQHNTEGLNSNGLVVRRGQPFKITLSFNGPYMSIKDDLMLRTDLSMNPSKYEENLTCDIPISSTKVTSPSQWTAYFQPGMMDPSTPHKASVCVYSPPTAIVGVYQLYLVSRFGSYSCRIGQITLLCNPWCTDDSVYLPEENQRKEYVRNRIGLLYMGTNNFITRRSWDFDQYESGILDICMMMLQVSNEHKQNWRRDYTKRFDPVYISRVVSAMVNHDDDCGVLEGNWNGNYSSGVNPSDWEESGSILKQWANSNFRPVQYGQCWVFAAVMCTVMRVLGIPTRVVTNFNSAHDTNKNMEIEEYYSEKGERLPHGDSIWNFHVWVECWMKREDLPEGYDGWQAVDPTPQERSDGTFRCGPAPVKAIRECRTDMNYDVPFIYAEVNAVVHRYIMCQSQILSCTTETDRVGALICTKGLGSDKPQDITSTYKHNKGLQPFDSVSGQLPRTPPTNYESARGFSVELNLDKMPVVGENICFSVIVTNLDSVQKRVREYANAQAKRYDTIPSDTFWEADNFIELSPYGKTVLQHQISYSQYSALKNEQLVNLAVVITDMATEKRLIASKEFNINFPFILIQVADPDTVTVGRRQVATVTFTNLFSVPVRGMLTVAGSALLEDKIHINVELLQPSETINTEVRFTPKSPGKKMLYATLNLDYNRAVFRGYRTFMVL
ncbi:transglutaminase 5, like [Hemibagrus wyckioides]|uniref:transglutaminase 5, like n=1 Tax=Hemibagrus wyckioides TaxID=337641 RepID=UPI00266D7BDB|nr:transglutaminase 5, like [Hemibagrus wyckioides]